MGKTPHAPKWKPLKSWGPWPTMTAEGELRGPSQLRTSAIPGGVGEGDEGEVWEHLQTKVLKTTSNLRYGGLPPVLGWVGENWTRELPWEFCRRQQISGSLKNESAVIAPLGRALKQTNSCNKN